MFNVRPATSNDLEELTRLQGACHPPELHEDSAVFHDIVRQCMSYVAIAEDTKVAAYGLVHGLPDPDSPPSLNTTMQPSSEQGSTASPHNSPCHSYSDHVFIHDVAVHVSS